jgi:hypothetical protein
MANVNPTPPLLTPKDIQRFWAKVDKTAGLGPEGTCWEWRCTLDRHGYGRMAICTKGHPRNLAAQRLSVFLFTSEWPTLFVLHRCDNPPCVRPDHLFLGTQKDNVRDMHTKKRDNHPRGEDSGASKLRSQEVKTIRLRYAQGGTTYDKLAAEYNVNFRAIRDVVRRFTWTHI